MLVLLLVAASCLAAANAQGCPIDVSDDCTIKCDNMRPRQQPVPGQECLGSACPCRNPCATMLCPSGTACQFKEVQCIRAPCPPQPQCVELCPNGRRALESDGAVISCHDDQSCGIKDYGCNRGLCCHECPVFDRCPSSCPHSYKIDEFGCNVCVCEHGCEHGKVYKDCGSSCVPTCADPNPTCIAVCVSGCHCPPERPLWDQGRCVSHNQCGIVKPALCNLEKDKGTCKAYIPKWYFSTAMNKCTTFIYGGCPGNGNRFDTEADCNDMCGGAGAATLQLPVLLMAALLSVVVLLKH